MPQQTEITQFIFGQPLSRRLLETTLLIHELRSEFSRSGENGRSRTTILRRCAVINNFTESWAKKSLLDRVELIFRRTAIAEIKTFDAPRAVSVFKDICVAKVICKKNRARSPR
jgi:hypothetical protein